MVVRLTLLLVAFWAWAGAASACRLAIVLAMDVSSSVDAAEDTLQRKGLAAALISPQVQRAVFAAPSPVAIAAFEWSGRYNQEVLVDWTLLESPRDLLSVAETIGRSKRSHNDFPTAMGYALGFGAGLLQDAPACLFQTIDIAGDGVNNEGFRPELAYANFPFDGVVVNGLVVQAGDNNEDSELINFYRQEVLRGPGAFLEIASGFEDYEQAMRRKLERELAPKVIGHQSPKSANQQRLAKR